MQSLPVALLLSIMLSSSLAQTQPTPDVRAGIEGVITVSPVHRGPSGLGVTMHGRWLIPISSFKMTKGW